MDIGGQQWVDGVAGAWVKDKQTDLVQRLDSGSFFTGLSRPWMGLHCLDSVRRDAAQQRFPFETQISSDQNHATIVVECSNGTELEYLIDLEADLIQRIGISSNGQQRGEINFNYLQDIGYDQSGFRAAKPGSHAPSGKLVKSQGLAWIPQLLESN